MDTRRDEGALATSAHPSTRSSEPRPEEQQRYLQATPLLDYHHPALVRLVQERGWNELAPYDQIGAIYTYVQNEIAFGYNESDNIPASQVFHDGYGQCNTKGTLLMALLRSVGVACRLHGFTIEKALQRGAVTGLAYRLAPRHILHSWVEVRSQGRWVNLEGFILDKRYLASLQRLFPEVDGAFCGYGVATASFKNPPIDWQGTDTFIQKEGITRDYGTFDAPDDFFRQQGANLSGIHQTLFKYMVRHRMNAQVARIRNREKAQG